MTTRIATVTIMTALMLSLGSSYSLADDMKGKSDDMGMKSDKMEMKSDDMHMKTDDTMMKSDDMKMKPDEMNMKSDDMKMKDDGMMKEDKTMKERTYMVPDDMQLRKQLTPLQYEVTRRDGTEPPFNNSYWDNKEPGIYVDVISGEPLFSSIDKYKSGTGWPSFTRPLELENIVAVEDRSLFSVRTEIRSKHADSHLGHVFNDGPAPNGLRYCMNSAALKFIPQADLEKEGYAEYAGLFK